MICFGFSDLIDSFDSSVGVNQEFFQGEWIMRVLLIEDDKPSAYITSSMLSSSNFNVEVAELGEEGIDLGKYYDFDIILLDLNLPDMPGLSVLQKLRYSNIETPVLILTGSIEMENKIRGLELGADDYVTKPFNNEELVARIQAIIRRSRGHSGKYIQAMDLKIDVANNVVYQGEEIVKLTSKEYQVLELFAIRKGTTISKEMIMSHLYNGIKEPDNKIIDVLMFNLRRKLGSAKDAQKYIETVWGRGYMLRDVEMEPMAAPTG